MNLLIWIHTVCPLVFKFSIIYMLFENVMKNLQMQNLSFAFLVFLRTNAEPKAFSSMMTCIKFFILLK